MKSTIIEALVVAALITGCTMTYDRGPHARTINYDEGGYVTEYALKALKTKTVRFNGWCASACTLYLSVKDKCATEAAELAFHRAGGGSEADNDEASRHLMGSYPQWVRNWINARGGLTDELLVMPASHILKHMEKCK